MNLRIVTPEGVIFETKNASSVSIPTERGVITVLKNHTPLASIVKPGELKIIAEDGKEKFLAVSAGIIQVLRSSESTINILADTAESAENIDIERAEEAYKQAQKFIEEKGEISKQEFVAIQAKLQKELARIRVGSRIRRKIKI